MGNSLKGCPFFMQQQKIFAFFLQRMQHLRMVVCLYCNTLSNVDQIDCF